MQKQHIAAQGRIRQRSRNNDEHANDGEDEADATTTTTTNDDDDGDSTALQYSTRRLLYSTYQCVRLMCSTAQLRRMVQYCTVPSEVEHPRQVCAAIIFFYSIC